MAINVTVASCTRSPLKPTMPKIRRRGKKALRFNKVEYTIEQVLADYTLRSKLIRRMECYGKQLRGGRERLLMLAKAVHSSQLTRLWEEAGAALVEHYAAIAELKAFHLNGGKPAKPACC
jgi:hypothetical protein